MTEHSFQLDGQQLAKLCKNTLPGQSDELLLAKIQALAPDYPVRLARTGSEWYRLGGIVDTHGNRVANDLVEWTERTFIECGKDLQALIDHTREQQLIATRQTGNTLYFVIQTGRKAADFIQLDIDKIREVSDRLLVGTEHPPEDLEEFIDPLIPECIDTFGIGTARYVYRRKTDVAVFMDEINKYHLDPHPVQRFMDDWNRSNAGQQAILSDDWIVRPFRHTGRFGEQQINVELINTQIKNLPQLDELQGKKGLSLHNLLTRFDRQAGYPFAWFFYMLKGKLVSPHCGVAVFKDISGDFSYLAERDAVVLNDWIQAPYNV
ncbi:MAG: hypothetical protein PHR16_07490 [Methylovulum sp.]|nr:hypothetical protein [Methylovulum sp.]